MKIALLTTQTPHHSYFASKLVAEGNELAIICETSSVTFPYETFHPYEKRRDDFERHHWFEGKDASLSSFGIFLEAENINCKKVNDFLANFGAGLSLSFGTRKICLDTLSELGLNTFNFHGADPEKYRGLDSHLWALWHKDYSELKTCLHQLNGTLDDGDIFNVLPIDIAKVRKIEDIRILNTENCFQLALQLISKLSHGKKLPLKKQNQKGQYYSAMPSVLKDIVLKRFSSKGLSE